MLDDLLLPPRREGEAGQKRHRYYQPLSHIAAQASRSQDTSSVVR
jgi:hypothetical protein